MKTVTKKRPPQVARVRRENVRSSLASSPLQLGTLLSSENDGWRVRVGREERWAQVDKSVDPALLREAAATGARVLLEAAGQGDWQVVGTVCTRRSLAVDPAGDVQAQVRRFQVTASDEVLLRGPGGFLQLKLGEAELYANRVAVRARELTRLLARMIKLN